MLDYRNRNEPVQLAWQGLRRQLTLFVSPQGRGVLFQLHVKSTCYPGPRVLVVALKRCNQPPVCVAAFLQAGLLVPAQDEALTVKATRTAMAKLDGDPSRLLS